MSTLQRPDFSFEHKYAKMGYICVGSDEVGRGCLAGPVVAASVVLPNPHPVWCSLLNDSKKISSKQRENLSTLIQKECLFQIAWCFPHEIDNWNILHASMVAMRRSLRPFLGLAQVALIDGHLNPYQHPFKLQDEDHGVKKNFIHIEPVVKGDQKVMSIAAASIVAKVYRDHWMAELDQIFPGYQFAKHKGYSTQVHLQAIKSLGVCSIHRTSFEPIKSLLA